MKTDNVLLFLLLGMLLFTGCSFQEKEVSFDYVKPDNLKNSVCMISDSGNIDDESFNQTTYEACRDYAKENNLTFVCKKPDSDTDEARNRMVDIAAGEGYEIIVMSGYQFAPSIVYASNNFPDLKIIGIDIVKGDILSAAVGDDYTYNEDDYNLSDYVNMENVYCVSFKEEQAGFLAGYMAVKSGFEKLGFMGGVECSAVSNFGYGYLQGIDYAAARLNKTDKIKVDYYYTGTFAPAADIKIFAKKLYTDGCEVIFSCGGGICYSIIEACYQTDKRIIGVDVDQKPLFDRYGENLALTSATKGLRPAVFSALSDIQNGEGWQKKAGTFERVGLISENDPSLNYVQLAESTEFNAGFSEKDYKIMISDIINGKITVYDASNGLPDVKVKVNYCNDSE